MSAASYATDAARSDLIASILAYRSSLDRLWEYHVVAVKRATAEVERRRDRLARGIATRRELEESERELEVAEGKLSATRREMVVADQALAEATAEPRPSTEAPPARPRQAPPVQKSPQRPPSPLLAWASAKKPSMPAQLRTGGLSPEAVFNAVEKSVYVLVSSTSAARVRSKSAVTQGSAVAVTSRIALTNCHVLEGHTAHWLTRDETMIPVTVAYGDKKSDRCAVVAEPAQLVPVGGVRAYATLAVGERVYTVGSPSGLENTLGEGIISGLRRRGEIDLVQTTAPMSPGSSGGGLFDRAGNLIGITTFLLRDSQNLNFAIAADTFWK
ncbi:MAG TPA: serine protease [Candidatus Acidoferrum sp.]|nr:serine protease [Candidatus Acidoferrum sp.]